MTPFLLYHRYKWIIPFSYFVGASRTLNPPSKTMVKIINASQSEIAFFFFYETVLLTDEKRFAYHLTNLSPSG